MTLHRDESLSVLDVRCTCEAGRTDEEETSSFELVLPLSGALRRRASTGGKSIVDAAFGYATRPGTAQEIAHLTDGDRCIAILPSEGLADELGLADGRAPWQVPVTRELQRLIATGLSRCSAEDGLRRSEVWTAVVAGTRAPDPPGGSSTQRTLVVERVREVIHADPTRSWTVRTLAAAVGYQQHHLSRVFKALMGVGLSEYRERVRLGRAMVLLRDGMAVTDVAHALGYCDAAHLCRRAKRALGVGPSSLRG